MKILIIGGTGFIGFNLLNKLKNLRFSITSISLSYPKKNNLISGVNYVKLDITNKNEIKKINGNFDIVINAGGYGGLDGNFRDTNKMYQNQIKGLKNVASFFLKKKIKKFIQVGSSLEYGSVSGIHTEKSHSKNPITIYGKSKLNSTNYLKFLNKVFNFPVVVLRLYQVYGPNQKNNRLIPYIIESIIKNKKIFTTKGDQIRDFCYIDDVTEAIIKCFNSKKSIGEIINIGYGRGHQIKDILKKIFKFFPKYKVKRKVKINLSSKKQVKKLVPSIKKAKKILRWSPKINFNEGIKKTINSFK